MSNTLLKVAFVKINFSWFNTSLDFDQLTSRLFYNLVRPYQVALYINFLVHVIFPLGMGGLNCSKARARPSDGVADSHIPVTLLDHRNPRQSIRHAHLWRSWKMMMRLIRMMIIRSEGALGDLWPMICIPPHPFHPLHSNTFCSTTLRKTQNDCIVLYCIAFVSEVFHNIPLPVSFKLCLTY